jgi:hypothetical protein
MNRNSTSGRRLDVPGNVCWIHTEFFDSPFERLSQVKFARFRHRARHEDSSLGGEFFIVTREAIGLVRLCAAIVVMRADARS